MNLFQHINIITIIIICIFLMPLLSGMLNPISKNRIHHSLLSILNGFKFILGFILSVYLVQIMFSDAENGFLRFLDQYIPTARDFISDYSHDIVAYVIVLFLLLSLISFILGLLTIPFSRYVLVPLADWITFALKSMNSKAARIFGRIVAASKISLDGYCFFFTS